MIDKFIERCVSFMVKKGAVPDIEDQREIYIYGLELQIYYIINATVLLAIGFLFGHIVEVALMLFLFGVIQSNGGGYHANTHTKCLFYMIVGVFVFLLLLPIYQDHILLQLLSVLGGATTVLCLAPVAHKNHTLSPTLSKKMGNRAKVYTCVLASSWCLLLIIDMLQITQSVIALVLGFTGISMIAAKKAKTNYTIPPK